MIKEIKYNGYTSIPSDYECQGGDLAASINLVPEDGQLKAIPQPSVIMTLPSDKQMVLFVHETTSYKHYIIYDDETKRLSWLNNLSGTQTNIGRYDGVSHCNAVGNTLIIFTEDAMTYVLWQDSAYKVLGDHLPDIQVSFGLVGHPRLFSVSDSSRSTFNISFNGIDEGNIRSEFSDENKTWITEQIMAKLNKFIREQTIEKGRFCFPFFVRYALRLYDGSLVCHSAPILMNPSTLPAPIVLWNRASGKKSYTDANCDIMLVAANLDYYVLRGGDYYSLEEWKDLITGIEVFISKPIYTYDQEGKIAYLNDNDNFDSKFIGRIYHKDYHRGGAPNFASSISEDCILAPINQGVSNVDNSFLDHYTEWSYSQLYSMYFTNAENRPYPGESFHLPEFTDGKINESIKNCATFYKLCTITLDEAKQTSRKEIPIEDDYLQSLMTREVMTDDYLTHDSLCADSSQVYNSRLNLSGVKRTPFNGFRPECMFAYCDRAPVGWMVTGNNIIIQSHVFPDNLTINVYIKENGRVHMVSTSGDAAYYLSDMRYSSTEDADAHINGHRAKMSWGNYLFYPNVNAFKMTIHGSYVNDDGSVSWGGGTYVIDLRPHEFLNGAFALLDYEIVRKHNYDSDSMPSIVSPYEKIDCGSKVFTSEVNNPFFFPVTGINTVGTGKILGMATAAKALSQGQFGQFPLYAFTTEGVWAMEVSAQGTYSAKQPITRDVCINPDSITQIDSAVLFATDRGIMLISGSQTQCISDSLNSDTPFDVLSLPCMEKLHEMLGHENDSCFPIAPFSEFLSSCGIIYNYVHQRIFVFSQKHSYAYVYSLKSKQWGMVYSNLTKTVNSYSEALAIDSSGNLIDFSKESEKMMPGLIVTRPIKLGEADILKTVDTVIQRGYFRSGHVKSVLYGSRDLFNWHLVNSSVSHHIVNRLGTPYKYFRIALLCSLDKDESVYGCTVQYTPRFTNRPR